MRNKTINKFFYTNEGKRIVFNHCYNICEYFGYTDDNQHIICKNPLVWRKNYKPRILNRSLLLNHKFKFPSWCPLEDYKEADHEKPA